MLCGLKQAPREWNKLLTSFLICVGLYKSEACDFVRGNGDNKCIIIIYVDVIIIATKQISDSYAIQSEFERTFKIANTELKWCLGMG